MAYDYEDEMGEFPSINPNFAGYASGAMPLPFGPPQPGYAPPAQAWVDFAGERSQEPDAGPEDGYGPPPYGPTGYPEYVQTSQLPYGYAPYPQSDTAQQHYAPAPGFAQADQSYATNDQSLGQVIGQALAQVSQPAANESDSQTGLAYAFGQQPKQSQAPTGITLITPEGKGLVQTQRQPRELNAQEELS